MSRTALLLSLALGFATTPALHAADTAAAPPPALGTWNLGALYADDAAFEAARRQLLARLPAVAALQGTLGRSPQALLKALDTLSDAQRTLDRLQVYAMLKADMDTRVQANQQLRQLAIAAGNQLREARSWESAEVVALGSHDIEAAIAAEPGLQRHAYHLRTLLRLAEHTLPKREEALLAAAEDPLQQVDEIFALLTNAELPFPKIGVRGNTVTLDQETYVALRDDPDPAVREQALAAFWPVYKAFERTFGAIYGAHLHGTVFKAHARGYRSSLAMAQAHDNTPEAVYRTLVAEADAGLPSLQRYLKIRSRLLHLKTASYADLNVPVAGTPRAYTIAEAEALTLQAVAPLGADYTDRLGRHFKEGWMDAEPRKGKRAGGYTSDGGYGVHPYVLTSFNGGYDSVSTLAHEWGHAMHSALAQSAQPFETAAYSMFVAEIPSTTNQMLLGDYMAKNASTKEEKVYAVTQQIELLRRTFFRQAMLAEFELEAHEIVEAGRPLTGEVLSKLYLELIRRYYGEAQGVMKIDDRYGVEWAAVQHLFIDFDVYQYATSISAAAAFADGIETGDAALRTRYLDMLAAGGSNDPYLIVKRAGVDLATPAPYRALVQRMDRLVDTLDRLTADAGK